jgi:hypothetical protein
VRFSKRRTKGRQKRREGLGVDGDQAVMLVVFAIMPLLVAKK